MSRVWVGSALTTPPGNLLTSHQGAIVFKWVYKVKRDERGNIVPYKARLMVKGYVQRAGVDYDEVFTPVVRLESVRLMLVVAGHQGWEVHHMDVKSAFLNGELKEEVYVVQPSGNSSSWELSTRSCAYGRWCMA
jgi:hypothetical protein